MVEKIKEIQSLFSVAGYENKLMEYILNDVKDFCDECYRDKLGNVICHKKGSKDKVLVTVPVSSDGLFITHISDDGKGKFKAIGDINAKKVTGRKVCDEAGKIAGIVYSSKDAPNDCDDLYIDFGVCKKEDVSFKIGDVLEFSGDVIALGENIYGAAISKWANLTVHLDVIKKVESDYDLYFAFTVMDNIGFKGAKTAAFSINPDFCITSDASFEDSDETTIKLSKGPVLRIKDSHIIVNKRLRDSFIKKAGDIPYQLEILSKEGLGINEIMYLGNGILTANINLPAKGIGEQAECVNSEDLKNLNKYILKILNQE